MLEKPIFAVDFDGTIVKHAFPQIGEPLDYAFEALNHIKEAGWLIVLWTCRTGKHLMDAVYFCKDHGLEFDGVNEDLSNWNTQYGRKIFATRYVDDRNIGWDEDWRKIEKNILEIYNENAI